MREALKNYMIQKRRDFKEPFCGVGRELNLLHDSISFWSTLEKDSQRDKNNLLLFLDGIPFQRYIEFFQRRRRKNAQT